jgi:hypothetical protein
MLLKFVRATAQVPNPQYDGLGVVLGQSASVQQHTAERYPRPKQPAVLSKCSEQMELGHAPDAGGQLAEKPPEKA